MSSDNEECEQPVDLNNLPTEIFLKLLVLGDLGVGKSSLVRKYCHSDAGPEYKVSVDVSHSVKSVNINGVKVNLQLWDIPGHERFGGMTRVYYKVCLYFSYLEELETLLILNPLMHYIQTLFMHHLTLFENYSKCRNWFFFF